MDTRIITGEDNQAMPKSQIEGLAQHFAYDSLNRLRYATTNGVGQGQYQQDYQYDSYTGNLLNRSDVGTYTYAQSKPHAVIQAGARTFGYDANGNITHEGGVPRFAYNPEGKLTTREGYTYSYVGRAIQLEGSVQSLGRRTI
jgi:hypothetical protein